MDYRERVAAVPDGGGCVAEDRVPVAGGFVRAEPVRDLLLHLRRAQVALGLEVGGTRRPGKKRSTSASRSRRHSSRARPTCLAFAPGTRRTSCRPTRTADLINEKANPASPDWIPV